MDPNETLRQIREHIKRGIGKETVYELFAELDEWLSKGGFLPDAWSHPGLVTLMGEEAARDVIAARDRESE